MGLPVPAHSPGLPPPCPWPRTPCQPHGISFHPPHGPGPQALSPPAQQCRSRAGLQLSVALPCLAVSPAKVDSWPGPSPERCPLPGAGAAPVLSQLCRSWLGGGTVPGCQACSCMVRKGNLSIRLTLAVLGIILWTTFIFLLTSFVFSPN